MRKQYLQAQGLPQPCGKEAGVSQVHFIFCFPPITFDEPVKSIRGFTKLLRKNTEGIYRSLELGSKHYFKYEYI